MAPHSSTVARKIPWTEEPGRLQSMLRVRHHWATSLSRIGEGNGNPLQCSCLENPMGGEAWWAAVYGVAQSRTRLKRLSSSNTVISEKAMAPHSSTLAWKIPWMEEPGGLQSMGSLRVGHDWVTSLLLFTFMHWRRKWQPTSVFLSGESQGRGSLVGCLYGVAQSWTGLKWLSSSIGSNNTVIWSQRISFHPCPCDLSLFFFFFNKIAYVFSFWGLHSIPLYRILFKSGFSWCSFKLLVCELADTGLLWPITVKCIFFAPSQNHWTEFLKPRMEEFFLSTSTKILCYAKV